MSEMEPIRPALEWIVGESTGMSSKTIWATMMGIKQKWPSSPSDVSDFIRCQRLLDAMPAWRGRIQEMSTVSAEWKTLVARWADIEAALANNDDTEAYRIIRKCR